MGRGRREGGERGRVRERGRVGERGREGTGGMTVIHIVIGMLNSSLAIQ